VHVRRSGMGEWEALVVFVLLTLTWECPWRSVLGGVERGISDSFCERGERGRDGKGNEPTNVGNTLRIVCSARGGREGGMIWVLHSDGG
jgi:hypothetical protein